MCVCPHIVTCACESVVSIILVVRNVSLWWGIVILYMLSGMGLIVILPYGVVFDR